MEYTLTYEIEEMELKELLENGDIAVGAPPHCADPRDADAGIDRQPALQMRRVCTGAVVASLVCALPVCPTCPAGQLLRLPPAVPHHVMESTESRWLAAQPGPIAPQQSCCSVAVEKRPKGHVLVEGETPVDKVKRDADLLAAEEEEEEEDEVGAQQWPKRAPPCSTRPLFPCCVADAIGTAVSAALCLRTTMQLPIHAGGRCALYEVLCLGRDETSCGHDRPGR